MAGNHGQHPEGTGTWSDCVVGSCAAWGEGNSTSDGLSFQFLGPHPRHGTDSDSGWACIWPWTMTIRQICSVAKLNFCKWCTWAVTWLGCGEMAHAKRNSLWLEVKGPRLCPHIGEGTRVDTLCFAETRSLVLLHDIQSSHQNTFNATKAKAMGSHVEHNLSSLISEPLV